MIVLVRPRGPLDCDGAPTGLPAALSVTVNSQDNVKCVLE